MPPSALGQVLRPVPEQLGSYCEAMLSQGVLKKKPAVSPSHPLNIAAKITPWPPGHHMHLCGASAPH